MNSLFSGISAVVFDMDGVIIDSQPMHYEASRLALERAGIKVPQEEFYRFTGMAADTYHAELVKRYGLEMPIGEWFEESEKAIKEVFSGDVKAVEGVKGLLDALKAKGVRIGMASSSSRRFLRDINSRLGISDFFEVVASAQDVEHSKPAPDIYLYAANKMGLAPHDCAAIEDANAGVRAAKSAGMLCIGFRNPNSKEQDLSQADMVSDSMEEIKDALV
jgi:HAD superfamily hydrolase (TIGR01509 family)